VRGDLGDLSDILVGLHNALDPGDREGSFERDAVRGIPRCLVLDLRLRVAH